MFFSLNKKFFFTITLFFLLSSCIFIVIFDGIVGKKIRTEHSNLITRNQYVIELLNENITLRKKISEMSPESKQLTPDLLTEKLEELSQERHLNEELNQNYNENYETLTESLRIISLGAALTLISLLILWILIHRWVILPLDKLTMLSVSVANGDFSQRLKIKNTKTTDEFDALMKTLNFMLDNIEHNITEIKQKELFLQKLIDALPDAIRIIDENYDIKLSNKAYAEYIKKNYLFNSQKCYTSYNSNADCACSSSQYICPIKELKKSRQNSIKLIHSVNDKPLSINSAKINLDGKYAIVESFRDLSENIHYSHQQKISSLGFLATSLAHEIKNNLGAINLILSGILQKYYNSNKKIKSQEQQYLEMVSAQIIECTKIPERLLKLSRNNQQIDMEFNIINSIDDILSLLDYEIKSKGIILIKKFSNSKEQLFGNETDFKMIILNLIQNSINAMPNGGNLEIYTNTNKENIIVSIKDSGYGIPQTAIKHIFEPFYTSTEQEQKRGTGLGLAIVKDLVSQFGATIDVKSKENVGTNFTISFTRQKTKKLL